MMLYVTRAYKACVQISTPGSDLGSRVTSNRRTDRLCLCLWVEMTHLNSQVVHHTHSCGGFEQRVWQPLKMVELANPLYNIGF